MIRIVARSLALAVLLVAAVGCKTRLPFYEDAGVPEDALLFDLTIPTDNCGVLDIQTTEVIRADLLLLQDRSRSMARGIGGLFGGQSKWSLMRSGVEQVVSTTSSVNWGLMLFGSDGRCNAPLSPNVPVGPNTAATIRQVFDASSPDASTPTTATIKNALAWFQALNDGHPHYMLLATDGEPGCPNGPGSIGGGNDSARAVQAVADAAQAGVKTFVVGIGSNTGAERTLENMALAGGVPNTTQGQPSYYSANSSQDLVNVLEKAALRITTCSYPLAQLPPVPDHVTIQGSGGIIPRDLTHQDGWDYSDDGKSVVFYGPACGYLQEGVVTSVKAIFFCPDH